MAELSWNTASRRKFTLLDAMILIAAAAGASGLARATWEPFDETMRFASAGDRLFWIIQNALGLPVPVLAVGSMALLLLRLKPPRARFRRIARQPGMVASCAAVMTLAAEAAWMLGRKQLSAEFLRLSAAFVTYAPSVSFTVAGAWLALILGGRWRPEPSWIDRAGRAVGAGWLLVTAVSWGSYLLRK